MFTKKLAKAAVAVLCAVSAAVTSVVIPAAAAAEFETADQAVSHMGVGWNLGNTMDSCGDWINGTNPSSYETAWGNPVTTPELIASVSDAGFNTVRVAVTWRQHIDDNGNIDSAWLNRVQEIVDYVLANDMYCVLNVHHDGGSDGWIVASQDCVDKNLTKFTNLWKNIATRFKNYDEKLIFEGFNEVLDSAQSWTEPSKSDAYDAVNKFNEAFVKAVRSTGGNNTARNLMLQTYSGAHTSRTLNNFKLPQDSAANHLIVQVHCYDPQGFTFKDATWTTMTDSFGTSSQKSEIDTILKRLSEFSKKIGAPVVVGEFGAQNKSNDKARADYAAYFVSKAATYGIKCFWWDNDSGNDFGLFNRKNGNYAYKNIVSALVDNAITTPPDDAEIQIGDVNLDGKVNARDVSYLLKYCARLITLPNLKVADVDGNGKVNARDASYLLKKIAYHQT